MSDKQLPVHGMTHNFTDNDANAEGTWAIQYDQVDRMERELGQVQGDTAPDSVDSGNPVKIGGKAETTAPTPVSDGDRVNAWYDEYGRSVVVLKDTSGQTAALTDQDTTTGVDMAQDVAIMVLSPSGGMQLGLIDDAPFTPDISAVMPLGAIFDDTATDSVDEGDIGVPRMSGDRILYSKATITSVTAGKAQNGKLVQTSITCTNANTNYAAAADIPADTKYLRLYCASAAMFAIGEATSATLGAWIAAGQVSLEPLNPADVTAGMKVNAQSPTAGSILYCTFTQD